MRWIPGIDVDRAKFRTTLSYRFTDTFRAGVEVNPLDEDVRAIANWLAISEEEARPALLLGTSSDRIGTSGGQAFYATLSKDLEQWTSLPIAPYAGASYGTFDDELEAIGGLVVRWTDAWTSYHTWDGHNLHHQVEHTFENGHALGFVVANLDEHYSVGVTWNWSFATPWMRNAKPE